MGNNLEKGNDMNVTDSELEDLKARLEVRKVERKRNLEWAALVLSIHEYENCNDWSYVDDDSYSCQIIAAGASSEDLSEKTALEIAARLIRENAVAELNPPSGKGEIQTRRSIGSTVEIVVVGGLVLALASLLVLAAFMA